MELATRSRDGSRKMLIAAAFAIVAVITVVVVALGIRSYLFPSVTVEDLVSNQPGIDDARDVTAEYCANEIGCLEAWETQYGVYMKFDSTAEADHWAMIFGGDGAQWREFVLDAREHDLGSDERVTAVQILLAYDGV